MAPRRRRRRDLSQRKLSMGRRSRDSRRHPWFREKVDDPQAPAHGFVRTKAWQLKSLVYERDVVTVTLSTESDAGTRRWWPHDFRLEHRVTVGAELKLELIVSNTGTPAIHFEEALHS